MMHSWLTCKYRTLYWQGKKATFIILKTSLHIAAGLTCYGKMDLIVKCFEMITVFITDQGSGFCVTGKIEAGYIQVGDRLLAMPLNETCTAKGTIFRSLFAFRSILG